MPAVCGAGKCGNGDAQPSAPAPAPGGAASSSPPRRVASVVDELARSLAARAAARAGAQPQVMDLGHGRNLLLVKNFLPGADAVALLERGCGSKWTQARGRPASRLVAGGPAGNSVLPFT